MVPFLLHVAERQRRASAQLEGRLQVRYPIAARGSFGGVLPTARSDDADEAKDEDLADRMSQ
jgi:hypothetical protein